MNKEKKLVFMLVADEDDRVITASTLQDLGHHVPIRFLYNANELFAALGEQTPSIMLIDYNLAPEPGIALLQKLKSDDRYSAIPVVILTDSPMWNDHAQCYSYGACTVIKKPASGRLTKEKIRTFFDYWIHVAETY